MASRRVSRMSAMALVGLVALAVVSVSVSVSVSAVRPLAHLQASTRPSVASPWYDCFQVCSDTNRACLAQAQAAGDKHRSTLCSATYAVCVDGCPSPSVALGTAEIAKKSVNEAPVVTPSLGSCPGAPGCKYDLVRALEWCDKQWHSVLPWNNDEPGFAACKTQYEGKYEDCMKEAGCTKSTAQVSVSRPPTACESGCDAARSQCKTRCQTDTMNSLTVGYCLDECQTKRAACWQKCSASASVTEAITTEAAAVSVTSSSSLVASDSCSGERACHDDLKLHKWDCEQEFHSLLKPWNYDQSKLTACQMQWQLKYDDCVKEACGAQSSTKVGRPTVASVEAFEECPACIRSFNGCRANCAELYLNSPQCLSMCDSKRLYCHSISQGNNCRP